MSLCCIAARLTTVHMLWLCCVHRRSHAVYVLAQVNSETDFVARNDQFTSLVGRIAQAALRQTPRDAGVRCRVLAESSGTLTDYIAQALPLGVAKLVCASAI